MITERDIVDLRPYSAMGRALIHGGQTVPISCGIASIEDSKRQANVEEEGRVTRTIAT